MIIGCINPGSGLGNMLHRYVATRVLALDKGYEFSFLGKDFFKGKDFMNLDFGVDNDIPYDVEKHSGKITQRQGWNMLPYWEEWDKHTFDPNFNFVEDNTIIDGNFEDERYFEDYLFGAYGTNWNGVDDWLKTERLEVPHDVCLIGFRGGEYYTVPELGLPKEYYDRAIIEMLKINLNMKFEVHTDDPELAKQFFPNYPIIRDISINWRSMRYAWHAIIANSSFYILPRLLSGGVTIAPKYFNRYNIKRWDYPQFYYKSFRYI